MLRRLGLQLARGRQIGQQGQVHKDAFAAGFVVTELTDGFEKRQAFDITHGAADFTKHEIHFVFANRDEFLDRVGHMGDDLNGFAEIVAATLFFQNVGIDATRGDGIGHACWHAGEAFVMAKV